jgi:predicted RNase H-like nuclease (RuvC/YqgF family)
MKLRGVSYDFAMNYNPYENLNQENAEIDKTKSEIIQLHSENLQKEKDKKERRIGFLAQEVEKVLPEAVMKDNKGIYSIEYDAMIPLLVEALKEQQKMIQKLEFRIQELEKR